jgi:hypothetical protein
LRDEQNSQRLALKWRPELEQLALHRWCWNYLVQHWTSPNSALEHPRARAALFYTLRARRTPPAFAVEGVRAAMEVELNRWSRLLR